MLNSLLVRRCAGCFRGVVVVAGLWLVSSAAADVNTTTYSYDALGRLVVVKVPHGTDQFVTTYTLDPAGNRSSVIAGIEDTTPPNKPTGLTGTALASDKIQLNWTPSVDVGGGPIWHYKIYRGGALWATKTAPPYTDQTVLASTTYTYRVSAVDMAGNESALSSSVNVTTPAAPDLTPPTAPTNLKGTAISGTQVNLSWTASSDPAGGSGVAGYEIFRGSGSSPIGTSSGTSYTDQSASPATTYTYKVRAYDGAGNRSSYSNQVSVTTHDTVAPSKPGKPTFSAITLNSATATWTAATDNVGVTGYRYRLNGSSWKNVGNVLSVNLSGLTQGTNYTMNVQARDAAGNWSSSSSGSFTTSSLIKIAAGIKPPSVLTEHRDTYVCQYIIDYVYFVEVEFCGVFGGGAVYNHSYYPPGPTYIAPGYVWTGDSLWVDSNSYGTW